MWKSIIVLAIACAASGVTALNCAVSSRNDCGYVGINEQQCQAKQCCWDPQPNQPWCFSPTTTPPVYTVSSVSNSGSGFTATLSLSNPGAGTYGPALPQLQLTAAYETATRVHFRITDSSNARYEIPQDILPYPSDAAPGSPDAYDPAAAQYTVTPPQQGQEVSLSVVRSVDGSVIFELADLEYSDQFLKLSALLPDSGSAAAPHLYGLGEHIVPFELPSDQHSYTMWNVDEPTPYDQNEYGSHPFYMQVLESGLAHGIFLRSSNGMDAIASAAKVQFRVIGGILEWYVFVGPQPEQVAQQYHGVIGLPHFPPYWSLGWHQCKYGWPNLQTVQQVVASYAAAGIPLDTIWGDIDYMDAYEDFSWDPQNYPQAQVAAFAKQLHASDQHYVVIVDPGIHNRTGYGAWDSGLAAGVFITAPDGKTPFIGKVWPGTTAFPDFLRNDTRAWWGDQIQGFLKGVPYDGLWIDMNEISNFWNGAPYDPNSGVNNPPYAINNFNSRAPLNTKTLPMDAMHVSNGAPLREYDVHNLYGLSEAIATKAALESIQGKRAFVLSRSTFPGSGAHTAHWLGDNVADWGPLYQSIPGVLNMNLYGVPMVGADICGFLGTTTEELCARWQALGAFYTFSRNHHQPEGNQEPYLWPTVAAVTKKTLAKRYSLLPTLYTLLQRASSAGGTVLRPLLFNFPADSNTLGIDTQFMWGDVLLVTPVLTQGADSVKGYWPPAVKWYDGWNMTQLYTAGGDGWMELPCSVADGVLLHIPGGAVLPSQAPGLTTAATRANPFNLLVGLDGDGKAAGSLFWDDGEQMAGAANALLVRFAVAGASDGGVTWGLDYNTLQGLAVPPLAAVTVGGFAFSPSAVTVNGAALPASAWAYDAAEQILTVSAFQAPLTQQGTITWTQ